ncbi:MAG: threonine-phosphate decarboxylase [Paracoccaceae bacterium]
MNASKTRDHGGDLDAAVARFGGRRATWLDLSTGINPVAYPLPDLTPASWTTLPDETAKKALENAARGFWQIPDGAAVLAAPGASALIARIPSLMPAATVAIPGPTYNEHAAAFAAHGWRITDRDRGAIVVVHPNNPNGRLWSAAELSARLTIIDESFADAASSGSHINLSARPGTLILKSFGKFWGLAGVRLGFAIGDPALIARLADLLGPWPVSGPALTLGAVALQDTQWAAHTRARLAIDADRLDALMTRVGASVLGGTTLFRLYYVDSARAWQDNLARAHIWSRIFPYSSHWLRLGLPAPDHWQRLEAAL